MNDDDLRYENLDDEGYPEDELEAIDLDALDDAIEPEAEQNASTEGILDAITTLDDAIEPTTMDTAETAAEAPAVPTAPSSIDLDVLDDALEPEAEQSASAEAILDSITTLDDEIETAEAEPEEPAEESPAVEELPAVEEAEVEAEPAPEAAPPSPIDLDVLDDAIEPEAKQGEKTEEILEAITTLDDEIEPAAAAEPEVTTETEVTPAAEESLEPEEPAAPPDWIYRVLVVVPAEMSQELRKLRELGEISDMPEPGLELVAPFRAENVAAVQKALSGWARNHLPLQLEVTGVEADVLGQRDFVAGWSLLPGDDLDEAQADLLRALTPRVTFVPDAPEKLPLRVVVGQKVAPVPFPRLVARMQRDFEPYVWHAETAVLVRHEAESTTWETVDSYR